MLRFHRKHEEDGSLRGGCFRYTICAHVSSWTLTEYSVNAVCYILYQHIEFCLWKKVEVFNGF